MYDDSKDYLKFLLERHIFINTEKFGNQNPIFDKVVNPNQNWQQIANDYATNRYAVVDNFLLDNYTLRLREFKLMINLRHKVYKDYGAITYSNKPHYMWFDLLTNIVVESKEHFSFLNDKEFERAWSFIYDNESEGVAVHADSAVTNLNFWVTPDECVNHKAGYNGLDIWKVVPPSDWNYDEYNGSFEKTAAFVAQYPEAKVSIEYKFNRLVIFDSMFFHKSQPVSCKPGYENRRINYTFLFQDTGYNDVQNK
jgi:hypothetical protein